MQLLRACVIAGVMPLMVWGAAVMPHTAPRWFEPNRGQFAGDSQFVARTAEATVEVVRDGVRYRKGGERLDLRWAGSSGARAEGLDAMGSHSQYFRGPREQWRTGVPHFARVRAKQVYKGIDAVYYWRDGQFEFDFVVAPGADTRQVRLRVEGARELRVQGGELVARLAEGEVRMKRPVAYQTIAGVHQPVRARYELLGKEARLVLGRYDGRYELVVDPVVYGGYFGGDILDGATATAVDERGDIWVAGYANTTIAVTPPLTPVQDISNGQRDGFLAKFEPQAGGSMKLAYYSYFGGTLNDEVTAMTLGKNGFVYLAGTTESTDFPGAGAALPKIETTDATTVSSAVNAFLVALRPQDPNGEYVWYSQTYGGLAKDVASAVAVDDAGVMYMAGYTTSEKLPGITAESANNLQGSVRGGWEGWLIKVSMTESSPLRYATFLGGNSTDVITGLAISPEQTLYVTGYTASTDFPITVDQGEKPAYTIDAFLVNLDTNRSGLDALRFGRLAGGGGLDVPVAVKVDARGGVWLAGYTTSQDFPATATAHRRAPAGESDVFLTRFDLGKSLNEQITYSTYLGGNGTDVAYGMALLPDGQVAVTGYTLSADYPYLDNAPGRPVEAVDAFLTVLDPSLSEGAALVVSRSIGGGSIDVATSVAVGPDGGLYVAGLSNSSDLPVTNGSAKISAQGAEQSFLFKLMPPPAAKRPSN